MPIRLIRDGINSSEVVNQLTWAEEVFYRRLLSAADDYGLYDARPIILRTLLYPLRLDSVSNRDIEKWHNRCVSLGLVKVYQVDGREYGKIAKYGQQSKSKPKWPIPPGDDPMDYIPDKEKKKLLTERNAALRGVTNRHLCECEDECEDEYKDKVVGSSTVCVGSDAQPAPTPPKHRRRMEGEPEGFAEWLNAVKLGHPSARQSRTLAPDVQAAALAAFERCPQAAEHAQLLVAYMNDRLQRDSNKKPFYRPAGQERYFDSLEDVLAHAFRWAKEMSWKAAKTRRKGASAVDAHTVADTPAAERLNSEEQAESASILAEMMEMVNASPYAAGGKEGQE